jgi:hypothetical protein
LRAGSKQATNQQPAAGRACTEAAVQSAREVAPGPPCLCRARSPDQQ